MNDTLSGQPVERRSPLVSALVALAIVAGCLLFSHYWDVHAFPSLARHWTQPRDLVLLIGIAAPYLLFALTLAVWGIDAGHRAAGCVCAVLAGVTMWGLQEVLQRWIYGQDHMSQANLRAFDWVVTLSIPTLLALAWGLARRRGRVWAVGVVVAPVLAAVHHELFLHSTRWQSWEFRHEQWWERQLLFVAPAIVAALACWAIEAATRSSVQPTAPARAAAAPTA